MAARGDGGTRRWARAGPAGLPLALTASLALLTAGCASSPDDPPAAPPASAEEPRDAPSQEAEEEGVARVAPEDTLPAATAAPGAPVLPSREPFVRVGLAVGPDSVRIFVPAGARLVDLARERAVASAPEEGASWTFRALPMGVAMRGSEGIVVVGDRMRIEPPPGAAVQVDGTSYRGLVELAHLPGRGLVVVNQVGLEDYLRGVVPLELGTRPPEEMEAVKAQAVAARTYAVSYLGRRDSLGFDLFATVEDQVYGGLDAETEQASRAVRETEGELLAFRGRPIRAYYHSASGGRTARVSEVWHRPDAPYLLSFADLTSGGGYFDEIAPAHRWEVSWTREELASALREGLAEYYGDLPFPPGRVTDLRVLSRSESGRVTELEVRTEGGRFVLAKDDIRFALRTPEGRILRSTRFEVVEADGEEIRVRGRGFGHGIGMSQWGAIGRARAGQDYRQILEAYYRGAELVRAYGGRDR